MSSVKIIGRMLLNCNHYHEPVNAFDIDYYSYQNQIVVVAICCCNNYFTLKVFLVLFFQICTNTTTCRNGYIKVHQ